MTAIETTEDRIVYSTGSHSVPTLHRCTVCLNLFNRTIDVETGDSESPLTCFRCGKHHIEPVQGYLSETQDLLVDMSGHPVLLINTNGQLKMSKSGKVQIGTRWCEFQKMSRSEVFTLHVSNQRNPIEVQDMGGN